MSKSSRYNRNFLIHPSSIVLGLILAGITALFLGFCGAYLYTRIQNNLQPVRLPILFYINSIFLITSSITLIIAKRAYANDNTNQFKKALLFTLILSLIFLIAQFFAWKELFANDIKINHSTLASYLYMISGVHFAHVLIGIPFLISFLYVAYTKLKHPISVLLYFSDLEKKRNLDLLYIYWHFLDLLWLCLVCFFTINFLIQ